MNVERLRVEFSHDDSHSIPAIGISTTGRECFARLAFLAAQHHKSLGRQLQRHGGLVRNVN
jgi:hypothetical protein